MLAVVLKVSIDSVAHGGDGVTFEPLLDWQHTVITAGSKGAESGPRDSSLTFQLTLTCSIAVVIKTTDIMPIS